LDKWLNGLSEYEQQRSSFSQHWDDDSETSEPSRADQRQARHTKWQSYANARPTHQAVTANKAPAMRPSHHSAGHSLSLASSLLADHCTHHHRHSTSTKLVRAHRHPILKCTTLTALPRLALPFPPSHANSRALGKPHFLLRHRRCVPAGVPPWPLPWPRFLTAPLASLFPILELPLSHNTQVQC